MSTTSDTAVTGSLDAQTARLLGVEPYIYLYPLVTMDLTRRQLTNIQAGELPGRGPMNTFDHGLAGPDRRPDGRVGRRHWRALLHAADDRHVD